MGTNGKLDQAIKSSASAIVVNTSMTPKKILQEDKKGEYKCTCCGKVYNYQKDNFPVSNSILYAGNNGYLTICKSCLDKYYQQLVEFYSGNEEHAIEHCCKQFDWYYSNEIVAMTKNVSKGRSRILMYPSKMNLSQFKSKGTTYLDTLKEKNYERIMSSADIITDDEDIDDESYKEAIDFFGYGYTSDEYKFLSTQYEDWIARYECQTKAQEELFKNLCITQLATQKAQRSGNVKGVNEALKTFQDLLGTANLKPSQNNDNALAEQNTFGTLIKKWETEKPIAEPAEEWKDVDGMKDLIDTYFLGHLCNLVHIKNDHSQRYKDEIAKYTVKPPVYEEDEDDGETSLLDKFSDKDTKK